MRKNNRHDRALSSKWNIYRMVLIVMLFLLLSGMTLYCLQKTADAAPDKLILYQNRSEKINWKLPFQAVLTKDAAKSVSVQNDTAVSATMNLNQSLSVTGTQLGNYQAELKLFGIIPCGAMQIDVVPETNVMPSGEAVGIYLESSGIMILGTSDIQGEDGFIYHPAKNIIMAGDYLLSINQTPVKTISQVSSLLEKNGHKTVNLQIRRGSKKISVKLTPVLTKDKTYQLGIWLREDTEGIGTMTCVLENNSFAALGHGITDIDTGMLIRLSKGGLYKVNVSSIVPGKKGTPGELSGSVSLSDNDKIGSVTSNNSWGITGTVSDEAFTYQKDKGIPLALKQEVTTGEATILCQLDEQVREYSIEITEVHLHAKDQKGIVLHVTDKALLAKTGGIVQGMSGSPIIQNGKLVGAVTHVFVNNPQKGYGIFIEEMLG
ncbi:MAG: SpoIVB peptidase [Lachnospiraceae bacterium]|nr:SpoIVB peptidase [Lachnospiraceae bacterium]